MLSFLKHCSCTRRAWLLITMLSFILEIIALWLQYIVGLKPCVFCIYERCALFGIMGAGLVGFIAPRTLTRYIAIATWLYSAWKGIILSWEHTKIQLYQSSFITCDFSPIFPSWLPLDKFLPQVFAVSSSCPIHQSKFLILEKPQWLLSIFVIYFIVALLVLIAQLFKQKKHDLFKR